jgi:acyl-CoA synthetase (AMP-forming)/AMP-acid ligase II
MQVNFNIVDLFYESAAKNPARIALIDRDHQITFGALKHEINLTSHYFIDKGIGKGDRILVFVPMGIDLYRIVLALFSIGAVAVFLDSWVGRKRLNDCCEIADCKGLIGTPKIRLLAIFSSSLRKIPIKLGTSYSRDVKIYATEPTSPDDTALLTFTTGSTGMPKAAIRTHRLLHEQFKALAAVIRPGENDVSLPVLPIVLLINLGLGITSVIAGLKAGRIASFNPKKLVERVTALGINTIIASPYFVRELSKYIIVQQLSLPTVRSIFTGGAPVFPEEAQMYLQAFPTSAIEIVYGSTEAEPISSIPASTLLLPELSRPDKGLPVGLVDKNAVVKIIAITHDAVSVTNQEALNKLEMPQGGVGEIIVSGPHVLRDYFNNSENSTEAQRLNKIFIGDICWHRTGDSGYMDQNGNLFLTGPCNRLIRVGDQILSPFLYERYFQALPGVETGTILSIHSSITAVIELSDKCEKEMIRTRVKALSPYFDNVIFVSKIPRDPRHHSKIDYEKLHLKLAKKNVTW